MEYSISRYDLNKKFLAKGTLTVISDSQSTKLTYTDSTIKETANELYHPLKALESLRKILESKHQSLIACAGCRNDTGYRPTGGYQMYVIYEGKQATELVSMFEPTEELSKLCTVEEHKIAYKKWIESLG